MATENATRLDPNKVKKEILMIILKLMIISAALFLYRRATQERYEESQANQRVAAILENVVALMTQDDYAGAYDMLNTIESGTQYDPQIHTMLQTCDERLYDDMRVTVDGLVTDSKYTEALALIEKSPYGDAAQREYLKTEVENSLFEQKLLEISVSEADNETKLTQLNDLSSLQGSTNSDAYTELLASVSEDYAEKVLSTADKKGASGDLPGAISIIKDGMALVGSQSELNTALAGYQTKYKEEVLGKIDGVYKKDGVSGVLSLLEEAIKLVPDASELNKELQVWKGRSTSIDLISLKPFYISDYYSTSNYTNHEFYGVDNRGGQYTTYCGGGQEQYVEYYIEDYDAYKFNASVYVTQYGAGKYPDGSYYYERTAITIYGDDKVLYSLTDWGQKMEPQQISLNIKGVKYLKIECNCTNALVGVGNPSIGW